MYTSDTHAPNIFMLLAIIVLVFCCQTSGSITFDLSKMTPSLRRMPESYYLEQMPQHKPELQQEPALELESNDSHSHNNLFTVGRMKGWWPVLRTTGNKKEITVGPIAIVLVANH